MFRMTVDEKDAADRIAEYHVDVDQRRSAYTELAAEMNRSGATIYRGLGREICLACMSSGGGTGAHYVIGRRDLSLALCIPCLQTLVSLLTALENVHVLEASHGSA
jgi:hypothetical protein